MNLIDFRRWAVVAHKDDTGLGRMARDARRVLGLGRHIVIPSERLANHPLDPAADFLLASTDPAGKVAQALEGLQGILVLERPDWHPDLLRTARERGVLTVGVPMWEWFRHAAPAWAWCDLFACPNRMALRTLQKFGRENVVELPWCLDLASLPTQKIAGPARRFVHNAGLVDFNDRKGTRDTIEAFRRVQRDDIRLLVRMQKEAELPPPDPRIEIRIGNVADHAELYRDADVAIQPSKMEGIGFMVLEAVAAGLPVVTLDYPPMNEFVPQPEMRAAVRWWKPRAFHASWNLPHSRLALPHRRDLARRIAWCADHDLAPIAAQNRAWAEAVFAPEALRRVWAETLGERLFTGSAASL
jgi:glycosyltransferase involved in cell wall biosynthesis